MTATDACTKRICRGTPALLLRTNAGVGLTRCGQQKWRPSAGRRCGSVVAAASRCCCSSAAGSRQPQSRLYSPSSAGGATAPPIAIIWPDAACVWAERDGPGASASAAAAAAAAAAATAATTASGPDAPHISHSAMLQLFSKVQAPQFQLPPEDSASGEACWSAPCGGGAEAPFATAPPPARGLGRSEPQASHAKKPDWLSSVHAAHVQPSTQAGKIGGRFAGAMVARQRERRRQQWPGGDTALGSPRPLASAPAASSRGRAAASSSLSLSTSTTSAITFRALWVSALLRGGAGNFGRS